MKTRGSYWMIPLILVVILSAAVWVRAQAPEPQRVEADIPGAAQDGEEGGGEVITGSTQDQTPEQVQAMGGYVPLRYNFSGVVDDGAQGVSGKIATSVLCTNTGTTSTNLIVTFFDYSSAHYWTSNIAAVSPGYTVTTSTQDTVVFADTNYFLLTAISQGYGTVRSDSAAVICSAMLLDPSHNPPTFMSELEMFRH